MESFDRVSEPQVGGEEQAGTNVFLELVLSVAFILMGLYLIRNGMSLGFLQMTQPGPGFLPVLLGALLSFLSIMIVPKSYRNVLGNGLRLSFDLRTKAWVTPLSGFVLASLYVYLMARLGFLISTTLFSVGSLYLMSWRGWKAVVAGIIIGFVADLLFSKVLGVRLPQGSLFG